MFIPQKSQKGANLRQWLVATVDALIDCITSMRIRPGPGIAVRETPAGTIVSVTGSNAASPRQSASPVLGRAGEGIRIDNGTASSVPVSGGTATAVPLNGATFTCTVEGGTTPPSGGGIDFPDWGETPIDISAGTVYPLSEDMWLIGKVGLYKTDSSGFPSWVDLHILNAAGNVIVRNIELFYDTGTFMGSYQSYNNFAFSVCRPIKAGYSIEIVSSGSASFTLSLYHT